jgi:hypothetical protein
MEAREPLRREGRPGGDLSARRDESDPKASIRLRQGGETGADLSVQRFVQEIESDLAVAGADSPCQNLLGG